MKTGVAAKTKVVWGGSSAFEMALGVNSSRRKAGMKIVHVGCHVHTEKSLDIIPLEQEDQCRKEVCKSGYNRYLYRSNPYGTTGGNAHNLCFLLPGHFEQKFDHGPRRHESVRRKQDRGQLTIRMSKIFLQVSMLDKFKMGYNSVFLKRSSIHCATRKVLPVPLKT